MWTIVRTGCSDLLKRLSGGRVNRHGRSQPDRLMTPEPNTSARSQGMNSDTSVDALAAELSVRRVVLIDG